MIHEENKGENKGGTVQRQQSGAAGERRDRIGSVATAADHVSKCDVTINQAHGQSVNAARALPQTWYLSPQSQG